MKTMSKATSKYSGNEYLPSDRPKVYPCLDCDNDYEFTERGLELHKRRCTHEKACLCTVCDYKRLKKNNLNKNIVKKHLNGGNITSVDDPDLNGQKDLSFTSSPSENEAPEGKSESSDSWENTHSYDSQLNPSNRFLNIKQKFLASFKSALTEAKSAESSSDSLENNNDDEPCHRKLFCSICNNHIFWESFGTHVLQHSIKIENYYLICPACNYPFMAPNWYLMHFAVHSVEHKCPECCCNHSKCSKRSGVHSNDNRFAGAGTCYICLENFEDSTDVSIHLMQHCEEYPFPSDKCNRSFRQMGNLPRRIRAPRREKLHTCHQCATGFSNPATLRNHIRTHTKEKFFQCQICTRAFSQLGNLKRHMAAHVEKEKDASVLIFNGSLNESNIDSVEVEIGPDDEKSSGSDFFSDHKAREADDAFLLGDSQSRTKRQRTNGQFNLYACKLCGKKYTWRYDLDIHFRTHRSKDIQVQNI